MVHPAFKQTWVASGVLINILGQAMVVGYPHSLLPGLRLPNSTIKADLETESWLSSSMGFSTIAGFFIASYLMETIGRRGNHLVMLIPGILGWVVIYFATNIPMLLVGRLLGGATAGATIGSGAIVIGEYTSPQNRGLFLNLKTLFASIGYALTHILSNYFQWRSVALLSLMPLIIAFFIILNWPESPSWLIEKKRYDDSEKVFYWLRGKNDETIKEFEALIEGQKDKFSDEHLSVKEKTSRLLSKFTEKDFLKPLALIFFAFVSVEACGRSTFAAYSVQIMKGITNSDSETNSYVYVIGIDALMLASVICSSIVVKKISRRFLVFASGISTALVQLIASVYLYLVSMNAISKEHTWIPVSLVMGYCFLASTGCIPVCFALQGEIFPLRHRATGIAVAGLIQSSIFTVSLKITPSLLNSIKVQGDFIICSVCLMVSLLYFYVYLPETKDRTLQEIEEYFNHGRFLNDENIKLEDKEVIEKMLGEKV